MYARTRALAIAIGLTFGATSSAMAEKPQLPKVKSVAVTGSIHMLEGMGGNIGVSAGPDGLLIVDAQFQTMAPRIKAALKALGHGDEPAFVLRGCEFFLARRLPEASGVTGHGAARSGCRCGAGQGRRAPRGEGVPGHSEVRGACLTPVSAVHVPRGGGSGKIHKLSVVHDKRDLHGHAALGDVPFAVAEELLLLNPGTTHIAQGLGGSGNAIADGVVEAGGGRGADLSDSCDGHGNYFSRCDGGQRRPCPEL
ncbi:MAG: hypothetical protein ACI9MR_004166 [Myxococcota bacterium]|jgi:hypothetical protein